MACCGMPRHATACHGMPQHAMARDTNDKCELPPRRAHRAEHNALEKRTFSKALCSALGSRLRRWCIAVGRDILLVNTLSMILLLLELRTYLESCNVSTTRILVKEISKTMHKVSKTQLAHISIFCLTFIIILACCGMLWHAF